MNVLDWLEQQEPGFKEVGEHERSAIMQFSLLWSLFESRVLGTRACVPKIKEVARHWSDASLLNKDSFAGALAHFRNRYISGDEFSYHFHELNFRPNDDSDLVKRLLRNEPEANWEEAAGVLIIVYRLRNNLFHGIKWAYDLQGQHDNFHYANASLMMAIELEKMRPEKQS